MAIISLGSVQVVTPGIQARVTANQNDPAAKFLVHALLIQALPANSGKIYIGTRGFTKNSSGMVAFLAVPNTNVIPAFSETISYAPNAVECNELWIDADVVGDGVIVSAIQA